MPKHYDGLYLPTEATGGATGGSDRNGADASDETTGGRGDRTTNSGDIPGVSDGVFKPEENRAAAASSDAATIEDSEPGRTLDQQDTRPYPGFVNDETLDTPGQVDEKEIGNERMGAGTQRDLGVPSEMREEMWDNARKWGLGEPPDHVNDERAFDDGLPGSWADFSVVSPDDAMVENTSPEGAARFADPNNDAGGEIKGPRVGGGGAIDGGPPRDDEQ